VAQQPHTGNPGNFAEDREKASRAGSIGGQHSSGNFANDRERAAEAGRKGGQASHSGGSQSSENRSESSTAAARSIIPVILRKTLKRRPLRGRRAAMPATVAQVAAIPGLKAPSIGQATSPRIAKKHPRQDARVATPLTDAGPFRRSI
jgi:general stress protein YciG